MGHILVLHGGPAILADGQRLTERGPTRRQASLALGYLALRVERPVPLDELAGACWPRSLPDGWRAALRRVLSDLRAWLAGGGSAARVLTVHGCCTLDLGGDTLDVDQALRLLEGAFGGAGSGALDALRRAAHLTREPLLPGLVAPWLDDARRRVLDGRLATLELLSDAERRFGDQEAAVAAALEVIAADPLRESAYRLGMAAYHGAGRTGESLRLYERCRRELAEALGILPSADTVLLHRMILGVAVPGHEGAERESAGLEMTGTVLRRIHHEEEVVSLQARLTEIDLGLAKGGRDRLDTLIDFGRALWCSRRRASQVMDVALAAAEEAVAAGSGRSVAAAMDLLAVNTGVGRRTGDLERLCERALERFGSDATVAARVGTVRAEMHDGTQAVALAEEAVAQARRCGDPATLLDTLLTLDRSLAWSPDVERRLALGDEAERLLMTGVDRWRLRPTYEPHTRAQLGDAYWLRREAGRMATLALSSGQWEPGFYGTAYAGCTALLSGDVGRARHLAHEVLADSREDTNAVNAASGLTMAVLREAGGVSPMLPAIASIAAANPSIRAFSAAHALGLVIERRYEEARAVAQPLLEDGLRGADRDLVWMLCIGALAEASALLGIEAPGPDDAPNAELLLDVLAPYSGQVCAGAHGVVALGAVDSFRGMLLESAGMGAQAAEALEAGLDLEQRMAAPLLASRSAAWLARALDRHSAHQSLPRVASLVELAGSVASSPDRGGLADMVRRVAPAAT